MKKFIYILLIVMLFLAGCGKAQESTESIIFGDINVEATEVDRNDFNAEWEIDDVLSISEQNQNDKNKLTNENFRIYYNRIAEQVGLDYLYLYEAEIEEKGDFIIYDLSKGLTGNYLYNDENGNIKIIKSELNISYENEEDYNKAISKAMAPIFGGMPYLKKYDLNVIYLGLLEAMKDNNGVYEYEFNDIRLNVTRDYNWLTVQINMPINFE